MQYFRQSPVLSFALLFYVYLSSTSMFCVWCEVGQDSVVSYEYLVDSVAFIEKNSLSLVYLRDILDISQVTIYNLLWFHGHLVHLVCMPFCFTYYSFAILMTGSEYQFCFSGLLGLFLIIFTFCVKLSIILSILSIETC